MNPTVDLLLAHRSIRRFTDEALSEETVRTIVACGQAAASSSNVQATSVIRVRDDARRARLAELAGGQPYVASAPVFLVWCADLRRSAAACVREGGEFEAGMTEHFLIASVDVALAAQNACVAAESLGLGICYIGGLRNAIADVADMLALPAQVYPMFGLCLGHPAQDVQVKPRLPLEAVLMEETYDAEFQDALVAEYDDTMAAYYRSRSGGTKESTWSAEMRSLLGKESRPHMKGFLNERGLATR